MREPAVELQPQRPPGRADRKAAAYAVQIVRLRSAGYTYDAIREALADIGIELSTSALRREVRRFRDRSLAVLPVLPASPSLPRSVASSSTGTPAAASSMPASIPAASSKSHGRDSAEAFFTANPSNPLIRTLEVP